MDLFEQGLKMHFTEPLSTRDFETIFTKVAEEKKPASFQELRDHITEMFHSARMDEELNKFAEKLKLDRTKLASMFKHK